MLRGWRRDHSSTCIRASRRTASGVNDADDSLVSVGVTGSMPHVSPSNGYLAEPITFLTYFHVLIDTTGCMYCVNLFTHTLI